MCVSLQRLYWHIFESENSHFFFIRPPVGRHRSHRHLHPDAVLVVVAAAAMTTKSIH